MTIRESMEGGVGHIIATCKTLSSVLPAALH